MILLVLGVINALISAFILAKSMGWLEWYVRNVIRTWTSYVKNVG
jgi:hypothetical protein